MASRKELTNGKYIDDQMGNGIPEGGLTGQILSKSSNADYDSEWVDNKNISIVQPSYKVYTALLTQDGSASAPTAIELKNTIGEFNINYINIGVYSINYPIEIPLDKLFIYIPQMKLNGFGENIKYIAIVSLSNFSFQMETYSDLQREDGILQNTPIEIRVYN